MVVILSVMSSVAMVPISVMAASTFLWQQMSLCVTHYLHCMLYWYLFVLICMTFSWLKFELIILFIYNSIYFYFIFTSIIHNHTLAGTSILTHTHTQTRAYTHTFTILSRRQDNCITIFMLWKEFFKWNLNIVSKLEIQFLSISVQHCISFACC